MVADKGFYYLPDQKVSPVSASDRIPILMSPEFITLPLVPLSVEMKAPSVLIPARMFPTFTAKVLISPLQGPFVRTHCALAVKAGKSIVPYNRKVLLRIFS
jgi:hypothetical protein